MSTIELWLQDRGIDVWVSRFEVREAMSALFELDVWIHSHSASIAFDAVVGKSAALMLRADHVRSSRSAEYVWTGMCQRMDLRRPTSGNKPTYLLKLRPRLWFLTQRTNHRLFQHMTIVQIVRQLLMEWSIEHLWRVDEESYPVLELKVQYGESDFAFMSRILCEAGISFFFEEVAHELDERPRETRATSPRLPPWPFRTLVVLSDHPQSAPAREHVIEFDEQPTYVTDEWISDVEISHEVRPGAVAVRDYDFRHPRLALIADDQVHEESEEGVRVKSSEARLEQHHYAPGSFLIQVEEGDTPTADSRGPLRCVPEHGAARARLALEACRSGKERVSLSSTAFDLAPGRVFAMHGHPHDVLTHEQNLLIVTRAVQGTATGVWKQTHDAVFSKAAYRPQGAFKKARVFGVQSATVVGEAEEEIHTDEFGRVRVQFPWDREGVMDQQSSCWMRVSQGWSGRGYGMVNVPRVGHEVLVAFLQGDPEQPIIVGRLFNGAQQHTYPLPAEKTKTGWRSDTSPGRDGFNEIMFEDRAGAQLVYLQAERNHRKLVKNNEFQTTLMNRVEFTGVTRTEVTGAMRTQATGIHETEIVGLNRAVMIGRNLKELVMADQVERTNGHHMMYVGADQDLRVAKTKKEQVSGDSHLRVQGESRVHVGKDSSLKVSGEQHEEIEKSHLHRVGKEYHLSAGDSIVIEADVDMTLKGPNGFIRFDNSGIVIRGTKVRINSGGTAGKGSGSEAQDALEAKEAKIVPPLKPDLKKLGL